MNKTRIVAYITPALKEALEKRAQEDGISESAIHALALKLYLSDKEAK